MLETWRRACLDVIVKHTVSVRQASRQFSTSVVVRHAAGRAVSSSINMEEFPCELIRYVNRDHCLHYELTTSTGISLLLLTLVCIFWELSEEEGLTITLRPWEIHPG